MATRTIKITDNRQGATFRTGVNGKMFDLPLNTELTVEDALAEHLEGIGVRFDEVETKRASSSKEGSVDELARPIGPHDVIAPGVAAKSLNDRPLAGDQPGDVTSGGVRYDEGQARFGSVIKDDAKAADLRVAAERRAPKGASIAELAGEGEQGTKKAQAQASEPSHKETAAERKAKTAAKPRAKRGSAKKTAAEARAEAPVGAPATPTI